MQNVDLILWLLNTIVGAMAAAALYGLKGRSRIVGFLLALIAGPIGLLIAILIGPDVPEDDGAPVEA